MMYQIHWLHEWCLSVQDFCNSVSGLHVGSVTVMITSLVDVLFNLILSPWLTTRDYVWGNTLEVVHVCVNVICDSTLIVMTNQRRKNIGRRRRREKEIQNNEDEEDSSEDEGSTSKCNTIFRSYFCPFFPSRTSVDIHISTKAHTHTHFTHTIYVYYKNETWDFNDMLSQHTVPVSSSIKWKNVEWR